MRTIRFAIALIIAVLIGILCVANSEIVSVALWPDLTDYALPAAPVYDMPLFLFGLGAGLVGFLLGSAREWARESSIRSSGRQAKREAAELRAKVDELTRDERDDDIPALPAR